MPAWVLRIPSIDDNCDPAVCWATVCPVLLRVCDALLALFCTVLPMETSDCKASLAAPMLAVMLVMVSVKAEMFASCERAAIAKPSLTPMPA